MKVPKHSKHQNQVRIIGGTLRGRKLNFASADGLRPTPDSVRERLFNWLGQDLTGKSVIDLFAGSGALGFEAVSRHAKRVVMCEMQRETARNLHRYTVEFGVQAAVQVVSGDGLAFLQNTAERFDVALLDPPFAWQNWDKLLQMLPEKLNHGALVYIEAGILPEWPPCFEIYREGKAGQSRFVLLLHTQATE